MARTKLIVGWRTDYNHFTNSIWALYFYYSFNRLIYLVFTKLLYAKVWHDLLRFGEVGLNSVLLMCSIVIIRYLQYHLDDVWKYEFTQCFVYFVFTLGERCHSEIWLKTNVVIATQWRRNSMQIEFKIIDNNNITVCQIFIGGEWS